MSKNPGTGGAYAVDPITNRLVPIGAGPVPAPAAAEPASPAPAEPAAPQTGLMDEEEVY